MPRKTLWALSSCIVFALCSASCNDDIADGGGGGQGAALPRKIAVIDAGSSGSRLKVYEIKADSTIQRLYPTTAEETKASKGGALSDVANHPDSVRKYLVGMTASYPYATGGETIPLYVLATAGMRNQERSKTEGVYAKMAGVTETLNGFKLAKAMTISGRYEGFYAWIAANYENHSLKNSPKGTWEVGGMSMQFAFATNSTEVPEDRKVTRKDWGTIYCKSYVQGGIDAIYANTPDETPFVFTLPLEDMSAYVGDTQFFGLSSSLTYALNGIETAGSFDAYVQTLEREDKKHRFMFAYYMQWVLERLHLNGRVTPDPYDVNWSEGAAYDIVINKEEPEAFDYDKVL